MTLRLTLLMSALLVIACLVAFMTTTIMVNVSPSMPRGVWFNTKQHDARSEIVVLTPPREAFERGCALPHQLLLKRVWAREGEEVCVTGRALYKRDAPERIVKTSPQDRHGKRLELGFTGCQTIPPLEVFVLGQHPSSCDSRHFGPVPLHTIQGEVHPLFILDTLEDAP